MNMMKFLRSRRTYRRFEQRPVAPEILTEAVDAARIASCGANRQTVRYIIVESADAVAAVQPLVHWAAYLPPEQGAPKPDELPTAYIAILQDDNLPGASDVDVGLALGSLTAAAWAHGVGSCIMGAINRPALTELLAFRHAHADLDSDAPFEVLYAPKAKGDYRPFVWQRGDLICAVNPAGVAAEIPLELAEDLHIEYTIGTAEIVNDTLSLGAQSFAILG